MADLQAFQKWGLLATLGGLEGSRRACRKQGRLPGGGGPSDSRSSQRAGAEAGAGAGRPGLPPFSAAAVPCKATATEVRRLETSI